MSTQMDLLLLVLAKHPKGILITQLHEEVAAHELQALRNPTFIEYTEFSFTQSAVTSGAYSHDLVRAMSELLRDGLIHRMVGGKVRLTSLGESKARAVIRGPLAMALWDFRPSRTSLRRMLFRLAGVNLHRGEAHRRRWLQRFRLKAEGNDAVGAFDKQ